MLRKAGQLWDIVFPCFVPRRKRATGADKGASPVLGRVVRCIVPAACFPAKLRGGSRNEAGSCSRRYTCMLSCNALKRGDTRERRAAPPGTTLVELIVATAIMTTIFAATLPLFVGIRNSTDTRWTNLEMLQNARVLNEHLGRYLAQATRIVAVSAGTDSAGYIECEMGDGVVYRCAVGARGYVEFGPVGDRREPEEFPRDGRPLSILAGPVEYLRFTCYDDLDFHRPLETPVGVRLVTWEAGLKSAGHLAPGKVVTGACCLRVP